MNESFEKSIKLLKGEMSSEELLPPIKVEIMLSKDSYIVQNLKNYTLADFLIALGGISRSFYFIGLICASFASKLLYKKALIEDIFMW